MGGWEHEVGSENSEEGHQCREGTNGHGGSIAFPQRDMLEPSEEREFGVLNGLKWSKT